MPSQTESNEHGGGVAIKISTGPKVYSLTSPPSEPEPKPPKELLAKAMSYADRTILVTVPFPDSVELIGDVMNHHLHSPDDSGKSAKAKYKELDEETRSWVEGFKKGESFSQYLQKSTTGPKAYAIFRLPYDPVQPLNRAHLHLFRTPGTDYGAWTVKLSFSAIKAGADGLVKLISGADDPLGNINLLKMLPDMRVSRIDAAVDLIGANPLDLIAHVAKPGKRMVYVGNSGSPESLYLYERKKPLTGPPKSFSYKTLGPLRMKIYERRDYHRQLLLQPPYGDCPVTRIEIERRWKQKKQRPFLANIGTLPNFFQGRRVAYAPTVAASESSAYQAQWIQFCMAAFGAGVWPAQSRWNVGQGLSMRKRHDDCQGNLIDDSCWSGWLAGIDVSGLGKWVTIANLEN